jgi:undecaprenyl-diphosphatase
MGFLNAILDWDQKLFLYLNSFHNDFWDTIMLLITRKETWIPLFAVILYFVIKNYRAKAILIILALAVLVLAADQLSGLMKIAFQRLRPVHDPAIESLVHNVLRKGGLYGFVSSHAANSVAILVFTSALFKRRSYFIMMLLWTVAFVYSRIYSGVHYPLDIIGGALLGWGVGYGLNKLLLFIDNHFFFNQQPKIEKTELECGQSGIIWLVFSVLVSTMFIVSFILHHYNYL